jgi:peroxiredoxin
VVAQDGFGELPATSAGWRTGPEVGEQIPALEALDQNGMRRSFDDVKGPNGALVFFFRSADW